jgi:hypothetical protein
MADSNEVTRRDFMGMTAKAAAGVAAATLATGQARAETSTPFWGYLAHLGLNMWGDREAPNMAEYWAAKPFLRFDAALWTDLLKKMRDEGVNLLVIDLGDGVRYESHPEIAVRDAWSPQHLKEELARVREHGIEPIPKMNFSTCHDFWLGPYARCVSTEKYYAVCRDLIAEAISLFGKPRFFHLGMDEETADNQTSYEYVVVRQYDLWWHDFDFYAQEVTRGGARPWIWSDYVWRHPEDFYARMPKTVLQSNWYYGAEFGPKVHAVKAYLDLEARGYDQAPTGSNWSTPENFEKTVVFCAEHLAKERLTGFLQTSWKPTLEACRARHFQAIEQLGRARKQYVNR